MKRKIAVLMSICMLTVLSGCSGSENAVITPSDEEIQNYIDSIVSAEISKAEGNIVVSPVTEEESDSNIDPDYPPTEEILSADIYSGKIQILDKVYTYPFTLNDLAPSCKDMGIRVDETMSANSFRTTLFFEGSLYLDIECANPNGTMSKAGDGIVTALYLNNDNITPTWYLPGGITKRSAKSTVEEKYGAESRINDNGLYEYYEEFVVDEESPIGVNPVSNNYFTISYNDEEELRRINYYIDFNSDNIVEWKFLEQTKNRKTVYISTPEYFCDYPQIMYNYGQAIFDHNGEKLLVKINNLPENKTSYLTFDNYKYMEKPIYNYPPDYSDESVKERIENLVYDIDESGNKTLSFEGSYTYDCTRNGDTSFDIIRRYNYGTHALIYGEYHENDMAKTITLSVSSVDNTAEVSDEALAAFNDVLMEMAKSLRFESAE